jgi:hypothetical protein
MPHILKVISKRNGGGKQLPFAPTLEVSVPFIKKNMVVGIKYRATY